MATQPWTQAAPYILATGADVLPMGGFSGSVPVLTLNRARRLVSDGELRYFLFSPSGTGLLGFMGRPRGGATLAITNWVTHSCNEVDTSGTAGTLYRCGS